MPGMRLIGLDGLDVDIPEIAFREALKVVKALPDGDAARLVKQLPESVMSQICTKGVQENVNEYLIIGLPGVAAAIIVGSLTGNWIYAGLSAIAASGIVYYIRKLDATTVAA